MARPKNSSKASNDASRNTTGQERRLRDTAETAEFLSVSEWYLRSLVRDGTITPAVRLRRVFRFDLDETLEQLARARDEKA
jgi:hypothetical protein